MRAELKASAFQGDSSSKIGNSVINPLLSLSTSKPNSAPSVLDSAFRSEEEIYSLLSNASLLLSDETPVMKHQNILYIRLTI